RGVVHVSTVGRKQDGSVVIAFERKVQVWKNDLDAKVDEGELEDKPSVECEPVIPAYDGSKDYGLKSHLTNDYSYFEDFNAGDLFKHSRGRLVTQEHIGLTAMLDNTSQVHCNQFLIDQNPQKYLGGQLIIYGGIPFNICLGLSCPDISNNASADVVYTTGRHTAPLFAGDTVFAETEVRETRDYPGRDDLGLLAVTLKGYKHRDPKEGEEGPQRVDIFYLERELAIRRRSHYA
ncbi:MAG: hypothetical protein ACE5D3_03960, partial [Candidatus Binatia bacterium]